MRANPHHITTALNALIESTEVIIASSVSAGPGKQLTPLYAPSSWNPRTKRDSERLQRITTAYTEFLRVTQDEDNGKSLETIVQGAIEQSGQFHWYNTPGNPPAQGLTISGSPITNASYGTLDHYLTHLMPPGIPIGVEDKNYREWIYPYHPHIKTLLGKCQSNNMLPVLVARKIHYTTRMVFHYLGAVAFETHFQCFSPQFASRLADARHKDGLGFADLRFTEDPPTHVTKLFSNTLPKIIQSSWEKFKIGKLRFIQRGEHDMWIDHRPCNGTGYIWQPNTRIPRIARGDHPQVQVPCPDPKCENGQIWVDGRRR